MLVALVDKSHGEFAALFQAQGRPRDRPVVPRVERADDPKSIGRGLRVHRSRQAGRCGSRASAGEKASPGYGAGEGHRRSIAARQFTLIPAAFTSRVLVSISAFTSASNC